MEESGRLTPAWGMGHRRTMVSHAAGERPGGEQLGEGAGSVWDIISEKLSNLQAEEPFLRESSSRMPERLRQDFN